MDPRSITDALVRRMRAISGKTEEELQVLRGLPITVKAFRPDQAVVREGDRPTECCLIAAGFCLRSKTTSSGQQQILSIHIPGEIPDLQSLYLQVMDHDLVALTNCTLGLISHAVVRQLFRRQPEIAEMFWRDTLIDAAMFREWLVNIGQRPAPSRLAHILAELRDRLRVVGLADGDSFEMPLTQERIGEAMGVTAIHANRVIKQLRADKIVDVHRGQVTILDEAKFQELADFDARYLHQSPTL
ncbi:Crp/Fnr family transcriptional regulator [Bradyrhizobium sp.]|uniref:Crp/Fnr family transcriptional regulator n=1 Tax=Bradyrhizobium sp. TaxID=376 RepID=UPI0025BBC8B1|nr:Crp/Fnr family transcriptional regulator [Bradyrhizobium sp.]